MALYGAPYNVTCVTITRCGNMLTLDQRIAQARRMYMKMTDPKLQAYWLKRLTILAYIVEEV